MFRKKTIKTPIIIPAQDLKVADIKWQQGTDLEVVRFRNLQVKTNIINPLQPSIIENDRLWAGRR